LTQGLTLATLAPMPAVVIAGAQWGDEGKGKVVDIFADSADLVVRYAGGPNAGHTLVVNGEKLIVRLLPSGILHPKKFCVLGQGMVIDPTTLVSELDALDARGIGYADRLRVSDRAHMILPIHVAIDTLRERGPKAIGTTKRGVGPAYEDKAARRGLLLGTLRNLARTREMVLAQLEAWGPVLRAAEIQAPNVDTVMGELERVAQRIVPLLCDSQRIVAEAVKRDEKVLLEGAQGALLDIDHGTYPWVTSSSATAGGACTGAGIGPTAIKSVVGLVKAYCTRVGEGPFPTEQKNTTGEFLQKAGNEFGSVTGRPRRTGWLDLPALKYAISVNGIDRIALTKLDVLTGLSELQVCVAYKTREGETDQFPSGEALLSATPVYKSFPGWSESIAKAASIDHLPKSARDYVRFISEQVGVPATLVSVGPARHETILLEAPFASH